MTLLFVLVHLCLAQVWGIWGGGIWKNENVKAGDTNRALTPLENHPDPPLNEDKERRSLLLSTQVLAHGLEQSRGLKTFSFWFEWMKHKIL